MVSFLESSFKNKSTTNYSSKYTPYVRSIILSEARPLLKGHLKARELWNALQVADYKKEGILNDAAIQVLYEKQGKTLRNLLHVQSAEELLLLLDEKGLGYLSEDEQILMFSVIKERMQVCASELCKICEYYLEKEMLKSIRLLETDIIHYQGVLRKRIHKREMLLYKQIGIDKKENFEKIWAEKFEALKKKGDERIDRIEETQMRQLMNLEEELMKELVSLRVKPKVLMKDMQMQEKMYAYNERFPEAHQIRNELNVFESKETERVQGKIEKIIENKKKKLRKQHQLEIHQQSLKNEDEVNRLKIKFEQEKQRLEKEITHHYNEIKKNHNFASNLAFCKGKNRDELRRLKQNSSNLQKFIKEIRESKSPQMITQKIFETQRSLKKKPSVLRMALSLSPSPVMEYKGFIINTGVLTKFSISSGTAANDRPVNEVPEYMDFSTLAIKTGKLLEKSKNKKDTLQSITELYDNKLRLVSK